MENNNKLFNYNNKVYKTEAAMKKAKTMDAKRANKQVIFFLEKISLI